MLLSLDAVPLTPPDSTVARHQPSHTHRPHLSAHLPTSARKSEPSPSAASDREVVNARIAALFSSAGYPPHWDARTELATLHDATWELNPVPKEGGERADNVREDAAEGEGSIARGAADLGVGVGLG